MEEVMLYDISGNLAYKKDRNGNELKYTYDTDDNLINVSNASRQSKGRNRFIQPDFSESYKYNADGTLKKAMSKGVLYTYQYDKQGRQIEKWQNGKKVLQYQYDKNGNMVCQKDISGKQTEYTFDDIGRIQTVIDDGEKAVQYYYNNDSTLQKICYGNGVTTEYGYDKDQSVVSLMTAKKDGMLITQNTYAYDENGNQIQKTEKGVKTTYAYDSLNQIKTVVYDEKVTEQFDYDAVGNRIKRTLQGKEENYYYNNKNQLLQIDKENDTIFYKYDNQGNTLEQTSSKGTTTYQYDIYNRTRQVTTENGDTIKNKYDPLGFRYKKEVNEETHKYIFDGWSITAETNKDGELKSREVRGYGLVKKEIDNNSYFYHQNEHGDITHLTNTDSEVENYYQYDVFGNIREQQENVENVFKYAGEQLDNETQQYYLRARFYNPVIARFTQEDVYKDDGLNLYVYVVNNPLLWIDPNGYKKCDRIPDGEDYYDKYFEPQELRNMRAEIKKNGVIVNTPEGERTFTMEELQIITDRMHMTQHGVEERIEDGITKYTYTEKGSKSPTALTIVNKHVFLSSAGSVSKTARKIAQDIFGEDNVTVVKNNKDKRYNYKPGEIEIEVEGKIVPMTEEIINSELQKRMQKFKEKENKELSQKGKDKFQYGGGHAEVKGIQGIKDTPGFGTDAVRYSVQFCSHLSCPSCSFIQIHEKVINCTGFSENTKTPIYTRDYKK